MGIFRRKAVPERKSASFLVGMGQAAVTSRNYAGFASEGYASNPVVHACVTKIAAAVATADIFVYQKSKGKITRLDSSPLYDLIDQPNPSLSGRQFRRSLTSFYLIGGNAYVLGEGVEKHRAPRELLLLDPGKVQVKPGKALFPLAYDYKPNNETFHYPVDQITGTSAVLHLKTFNPLETWMGLAPMTAAAYGVDIFNSGMVWNKKLLDNDCRPSGALTVKDADGKPATLSDDQRFQLEEMLNKRFSGAGNNSRPLVMEGGLEWMQLALNPKDMDFRENMLTAARFIASVFGVPPQLINIPGESTYANYEQAEVSFWANTVLPLLGAILDDLNRWLAPLYGDGVYLWYDEEMIPALEPLRNAKSTRINASGFMTINEKREAMGLEAIEGGEALLVPSTSIPLDLAGNMTLPEPGSPADAKPDDGQA